ncbi:MAG: alkaline phosphatase [Bacteroidia bacterium]|nr:alkaline phosphatase [Bacteroidia bacterium]NNF30629.1 alkaline phosphatase [Flavobacteriaceae bacterium]MBT8276296.1 alkaline phosphatase [Bacteroidia bacterium]NNJ81733.1 alkaline phosphatase [Flavobacteriaceae bacterium]NNK53189.1 alkaline phosphatase [Flavobacteriaceae bacterium]
MRYLLILILIGASTLAWSQSPENSSPERPKNIILLIGDGMGMSQVSVSFYFNENESNFNRFTNIGLIRTSSSAQLITDSAAGATAFASGIKSYNGAIGVNPKTESVPTIFELMSKNNYATGIISTSSVVHATPAAFYAHVFSRRMYEVIAANLAESEVDFIAGGGSKFFNARTDGKNLYDLFAARDFEIHTESIPETLSGKKQLIILAEDGMPKMIEGRGDFLPKSTDLAIDYLSKNKEGFFLVIEGSQIDWAGHDNNADYLIGEQLDFDKTIGVALDFAKENGETLVIVTADHETGGLTLSADGNDYNKISPIFSTGGHSATLIPVFTYGPGASSFNGIYENTEIFHKMMALLNKK